MATRNVSTIWTRKLDLLYLCFFLIHIPVMFVIDLTPLYPPSLKPQFLLSIRNWYTTNYRDRFFIDTPPYFNTYLVLEMVYHVPVSLWAVGALLRGDPRLPLHLLIWSVETAITTLTCTVEMLNWKDFSNGERFALGQLYVPYLALAVGMGVDMFLRLERRLRGQDGKEKVG